MWCGFGERHHDASAGRTVFETILDQVFQQAQQFLVVACDDNRLMRKLDIDHNLTLARQRLQPIDHLTHQRHDVDQLFGPHMRAELDPRQRQKIVDQPRHARRLRVHDAEKTFARLGVLARRSLQRIDESRQRCERGAQFVARIGDEVGAHFLDPAQRRLVLECHQNAIFAAAERSRQQQRRHDQFHPAVDRNAIHIAGALRLTGGDGFAQRRGDFGRAQREQRQFVLAQSRRPVARRRC